MTGLTIESSPLYIFKLEYCLTIIMRPLTYFSKYNFCSKLVPIARKATVASVAQLAPVASVAPVLLVNKVHPVERMESITQEREELQ